MFIIGITGDSYIIVASPYGGQVHFLHEFISCSKSLQMVQQLRLFRYVACGVVQVAVDTNCFCL